MSLGPALVIAGLLGAGVINLLPLPGLLGASWLQRLYGFQVAQPDLDILLRHRALLFGIVGALLIASIALPQLRQTAMLVGFVSMAGFIAIALLVGGYGPAIQRVVVADAIGIAGLAVAFVGGRLA